ncbi:MAG: polyphenol oxidase family protein [Candidatus Methylomirabilis sp.]|nr:polyphenol oxidase family protein [Candidatus Methylomirabilis sp.]
MSILRLQVPHWEQFDGLIHGFLGRFDGRGLSTDSPFRLACSNHEDRETVQQNWCDLKQALNLPRITIVTARQVHGNAVLEVSRATDKQAGVGDGLMTDAPNLCVGVMAADCVPILFMEPVRKIAAAVHAGWRGDRCRHRASSGGADARGVPNRTFCASGGDGTLNRPMLL